LTESAGSCLNYGKVLSVIDATGHNSIEEIGNKLRRPYQSVYPLVVRLEQAQLILGTKCWEHHIVEYSICDRGRHGILVPIQDEIEDTLARLAQLCGKWKEVLDDRNH
jgi:hypothetical protein